MSEFLRRRQKKQKPENFPKNIQTFKKFMMLSTDRQMTITCEFLQPKVISHTFIELINDFS